MSSKILIFAAVMAICICGCATAVVYDADGKPVKSVTSYGAFRDITHTIETVKPDGTIIRDSLSSKSTTSDIMKAGNEIMGTIVNAASKTPGL